MLPQLLTCKPEKTLFIVQAPGMSPLISYLQNTSIVPFSLYRGALGTEYIPTHQSIVHLFG